MYVASPPCELISKDGTSYCPVFYHNIVHILLYLELVVFSTCIEYIVALEFWSVVPIIPSSSWAQQIKVDRWCITKRNMFTYLLKNVFSTCCASLVHLNSVLLYTCNTEQSINRCLTQVFTPFTKIESMYLELQFVQDLMMLDLLCYWLHKNSFPYPPVKLQECRDRAVFLLVSADHPCTTCMLVQGSSLPHRWDLWTEQAVQLYFVVAWWCLALWYVLHQLKRSKNQI